MHRGMGEQDIVLVFSATGLTSLFLLAFCLFGLYLLQLTSTVRTISAGRDELPNTPHPIIKGMQDRPLTLFIFHNYQLRCFSSAPETLQCLLIDGAAVAEEVWKVTTNEAKAEEVFTILLAHQHLDQDLFTDAGLMYTPFPPKGHTKVCLRRELYIFVKHLPFLLHFQLELAVQCNIEDMFPHTMCSSRAAPGIQKPV